MSAQNGLPSNDLQEAQLKKSSGSDWRGVNAELLARPLETKRRIINHRLIREGDGNAAEIFAIASALDSEDWRGPRYFAWARLDKLVAKDKNTMILPGEGEPCPDCGSSTEIREHVAVTEKLLKQPRYSTRWFLCTNWRCGTIIFPTCFMVPEPPPTPNPFDAFNAVMSQALGEYC